MDTQLSLTTEFVDLTDEEKMQRGLDLANLIREATVMEADHKDRKAAMREEREVLEQQIAHVADVVRAGKEERPKGISR